MGDLEVEGWDAWGVLGLFGQSSYSLPLDRILIFDWEIVVSAPWRSEMSVDSNSRVRAAWISSIVVLVSCCTQLK